MAEEALKKVIPKNSETISQWADEWESELRREGINVVYNRLTKQLGMDSKDFRLVIDSTDIKISIWSPSAFRFLSKVFDMYCYEHWKELYFVDIAHVGHIIITEVKYHNHEMIRLALTTGATYSVFRLLEAEKTKFKLVAG